MTVVLKTQSCVAWDELGIYRLSCGVPVEMPMSYASPGQQSCQGLLLWLRQYVACMHNRVL